MGKNGNSERLFFFFLVSKITADVTAAMKLKDSCSLEERNDKPKTCIKNRDILPTTFHIVKAMVFPVVMYGCESWTIKEAGS